jgi:tripartite-type tricarboxylate transporter receptor subunit TctC
VIGASAIGASTIGAHGQTKYPSRNISILVGVAAGSQTDVFARLMANALQKSLQATVIVENRPGAGGTIAGQAGVRAEPDGHTLILGSNSPFVVAPHLRATLPYNTPKDFAAVSMIMNGPSVIVAREGLAVKNLDELIAYVKANPGKLNFGSHGFGAFSHIVMELFMAETGLQMTHVPFNGGGPLTTAFIRGDVDVACFDVYSILPHIREGKVRLVAQVGEQRSPLFPETPLVSETIPGVKADYWFGVFAPAATPAPILDQLHGVFTQAIALPESKTMIEQAAMVPGTLSRQAFAAKVENDWEHWARIVKQRKIQLPG